MYYYKEIVFYITLHVSTNIFLLTFNIYSWKQIKDWPELYQNTCSTSILWSTCVNSLIQDDNFNFMIFFLQSCPRVQVVRCSQAVKTCPVRTRTRRTRRNSWAHSDAATEWTCLGRPVLSKAQLHSPSITGW